jgi:GAF domain-containing protein
VAARQRARDTHDQAMVLAWHVAALERQTKLPGLKTLLHEARPKDGKQKNAHQRAVMQQLSAQLGIEIRRTRLVRREIH